MGKVIPPPIKRPKNIPINFSRKLGYLSPMDDMKYIMNRITAEKHYRGYK